MNDEEVYMRLGEINTEKKKRDASSTVPVPEMARGVKSTKTVIPRWIFTAVILCASITVLLDGLCLLAGAYPKIVLWPKAQDGLAIIGNLLLILLAITFRECRVSVLVEEEVPSAEQEGNKA